MLETILFCLFLAQVVTLVGLGVVAYSRIKRDPKIGRPIYSRPDSRERKPILFAVHIGLVLVCSQADDFPTMHAVVALYGAFMLTWLAPGDGDFGIGEMGIYQGWVARRFEDFDEWQLGQDQLRLRLGGAWMSMEVPRDKRSRLRAALTSHAPDRESP